MDLIKPENLLSLLKHKHVLLDTNILIDSLIKPTAFRKFFNELKDNSTIITSIEPVAFEFLQGVASNEKYKEKKETLDKLVEVYLPITQDTYKNVYELIKLLGIDGKDADLPDLLLGGILMEYPERLYLFTKNARDFPTHIFKLESVFNLPQNRSIQTYGVYTFSR